MPDPSEPRPAGRRRLAIYYAVLSTVTAAVVGFVVVAGAGEHAPPTVAGGYDVSAGGQCLGTRLDLVQSGRFVSVQNPQSTLTGDLDLRSGRLRGTVRCVGGVRARLDAGVGGGSLSGTVAGGAVQAALKRDPPDAGAPKPLAPAGVTGRYALAPASTCLGGKITLRGSGSRVTLAGGRSPGTLTYRKGALSGMLSCIHGGRRQLSGTAAGRQLDLFLTPAAGSTGAAAEHLTATRQRTSDDTVVAFFVAVIVVMIAARLCGSLMPRIGQPRVMGEVIAGILLGPTAFGALDPGLQSRVFAPDIVPYIGVSANLGLIFYMFLIGLEVDVHQLRGRMGTTLAISNTGLAVPMMLGMLSALPLYPLLAPEKRFLAFALFAGVSMSITAFPVLARIISERRMLKRPLGALALSAAAVDDVSAWFLIALATAVASAGSGLDVLQTIGWAGVYCLVMAFVVRRILARASIAYDEVGRLPGTWITAIFAGVLLSAVVTETIGIAVIFGAFVMGLAMPGHAGLTEDVTRRVEDFVLTLLLPLFFAYTGLRTNIGQLGRPELLGITAALVGIAVAGKYGGTLVAARVMRLGWRESAVLGALMNTRGLTELIVLNLALDKGVISSALFTALVIMALLTTFMAGPLLRLLDPSNSFGEPVEQEMQEARRLSIADSPVALPERSILVAPQTGAALDQLLALARPLARSEPPRELILARAVPPPRGTAVRGGLQSEARLLREASDQVHYARVGLLVEDIAARALAFSSAEPGRDLVRLAGSEEVDLLMLDGRRPLLGDGIPREDVGTVLREAPCDVAVMVAREGVEVVPGPERSVMVPFGGAEHDWAALELAAWLCSATGAPLELLGAAGQTTEGKDAGGLLDSASALVSQFVGISARAVLAPAGRDGVLSAAQRASLLIVGLSEDWRQVGLGETRRAIARSASAPILFARRGTRAGALSPAGSMTRFAWSSAGAPRQR